MMEAGLEPELLCGGRDVLAQGLLWFFVVDKRKRELDDIAEGNCNYRRCFPVVMLCSQLHLDDCEMSLCSGFSVDLFSSFASLMTLRDSSTGLEITANGQCPN